MMIPSPQSASHALEFVDQGGAQHHVLVTPDRVLLDEHAYVKSILVLDTTIHILSDASTHGTVCTPMALWEACAGHDIDPTAIEAGRLLAAVLAGLVEKQQLQAMVRTVQESLSQRCDAVMHLLPRQRQRLDAFAEQCLDRCDGTVAGIQAVAQLLDVSSEQVRLWGQQRGKRWASAMRHDGQAEAQVPLEEEACPDDVAECVSSDTAVSDDPQTSPHLQAEQETLCYPNTHPLDLATELPLEKKPLRWTAQMLQQLDDLFEQLAPHQQTMMAVIEAIAQHAGWPVEKVQYQCYQRRLHERFRGMPRPASSSTIHEEAPTTNLDTPAVEATPSEATQEASQALPLPTGVVLWDVRIGSGETAQQERWRLDFPYGCFPYHQGQQISYNDHQYHIERVYSSQLMVCQI